MEQEKVINPGLAFWVTEYNLYQKLPLVWKTSGIAIDGDHGFGNDKNRYFDGEVILISSENRIIQYLSISYAHFSRGGFKYMIKEAESLPQPPFLISSDLAIRNIFDGYIEISEDRGVVDFSESDDYAYPVGTKDWFGLMIIKGNNKVCLVAFSPKKNVIVLDDDELWSFEWDCSIAKIKPIIQS